MTYIRSIQDIKPEKANGLTIVYLLGYGGRMWQSARQLKVLSRQGYFILAVDFFDILKSRDPQNLIDLIDEVDAVVAQKKLISKDTIIVGISLGGLIGFNLLKKHRELNKLIVITGGNMARIPTTLHQKWPLTYDQLLEAWKDVNIFTPVGEIKDKNITMILPKRDKMINPDEVVEEINHHTGLNRIKLVRSQGGHFRTIITETMIRPKKSLTLIDELKRF